MSTLCITHSSLDVPPEDRPVPCVVRGEHYPACPGFTLTGRTCKGCLPRMTEHGYLCDSCWERYVDALGRVGYLAHHLRSIEKSAQAVGERVSTSREPRLPVPDSWLAADGLVECLNVPVIPARMGIDEAGRYVQGAARLAQDWAEQDALSREAATRAVVLIRRMHQALARWPDSETATRPIPHVRCLKCFNPTLLRVAPRWRGDDMLVRCISPECGFEDDWFTWWATTKPYLDAYKALKTA